jgi:hypothetical protein
MLFFCLCENICNLPIYFNFSKPMFVFQFIDRVSKDIIWNVNDAGRVFFIDHL